MDRGDPAFAVGRADSALPAYQPEREAAGELSSVGDGAMTPLMDAWLAAFRERQAACGRDAGSTGAMPPRSARSCSNSPTSRPRARNAAGETAPYAHQFSGDMMKVPLLVRVVHSTASRLRRADKRRIAAAGEDEGVSLVRAERDGQEIVARDARFSPLAATEAAQERAKLDVISRISIRPCPLSRPAARERRDSQRRQRRMKTLMDAGYATSIVCSPACNPARGGNTSER